MGSELVSLVRLSLWEIDYEDNKESIYLVFISKIKCYVKQTIDTFQTLYVISKRHYRDILREIIQLSYIYTHGGICIIICVLHKIMQSLFENIKA